MVMGVVTLGAGSAQRQTHTLLAACASASVSHPPLPALVSQRRGHPGGSPGNCPRRAPLWKRWAWGRFAEVWLELSLC